MGQQPNALRGIKVTQMILRTAFLLALVIGLGGMFGWLPFTPATVDLHIASGIIVAISMAALAANIGRFRRPGAAVLWTGVLLVVAGGFMALYWHIAGNALGLAHLALMLVAMGLAEMGAARAKRSA